MSITIQMRFIVNKLQSLLRIITYIIMLWPNRNKQYDNHTGVNLNDIVTAAIMVIATLIHLSLFNIFYVPF